MHKKLILILSFMSVSAFANYDLLKSNKAIECYGADNQVVTLNAERTTLEYTVEGETPGPEKITKTVTNNRSYATYTSENLILSFSKNANVFIYRDSSNSESFECHELKK